MKRSHLIDIPPISHDAEFIRQVAFHEAGHAAAIHIRNKQQQLPPIYFKSTLITLIKAMNVLTVLMKTQMPI